MAIRTSKITEMENSKRKFNEYQFDNSNPDDRYEMAYKRVKKIKGFYGHVMVYFFVNAVIIFSNYYGNSNEDSFSWSLQTFSTAFFWGIGLVAHGLSTFGGDILFGQKWEEKKIQKLMDKEKSEKWE